MEAVSKLVKRSDASVKMDELMKAGAKDILLFTISNSRM
jgi:ATP phosphoribosyltransferase